MRILRITVFPNVLFSLDFGRDALALAAHANTYPPDSS